MITRHSKLSAADQEGLRSRAKPKAIYPGLKTIKYSRIENVPTHILYILLLRIPKDWIMGETCLAISIDILCSVQLY